MHPLAQVRGERGTGGLSFESLPARCRFTPRVTRFVCTPFYPQSCGHPLWGQRNLDGLTTFRSALVGGLAAAVVQSHRVPSYGGIHGIADRPPPPVFFNPEPPSGRLSASAPPSGRGPAVPTGRLSCVEVRDGSAGLESLNSLVRVHLLRAVHDSVISCQPKRRNPNIRGVIRECDGRSRC